MLAVAAAFALVLLLAPPDSNYVWAVNGWRSIGWPARAAVLAAAGAGALLVYSRARGMIGYLCLASIVAMVAAFPLRVAVELLGDTQLRLRSLSAFTSGIVTSRFDEWSARLHAAPLDILADLLIPVMLVRSGLSLRDAVACAGAVLAVVWFAAHWRLAARLGAAPALRMPLALALATSGTLLAFASYAESAALLAAATAWWWAEMLAPLDRRTAVVRLAIAWGVVVLSHRVGLLLAVPMAWRALSTPLAGDRDEHRRKLLPAAALTLGAGLAVSWTLGGHERLSTDLSDLLAAVRSLAFLRVPPTDVLNGLVLVAPLLVFASVVRQQAARPPHASTSIAPLVWSASLPLLVVTWLLPLSGNGLGSHRDWDANIPLGVTLTVAAGAGIAALPAAPQRAALLLILPLQILLAGGWLAVNADAAAMDRRAHALATQAPLLPDPQRSHVLLFEAQRAMDGGRFADGARAYEQSFALSPAPRRALLAAEAWIVAGDAEAARRMIAVARARGELTPELAAGAARLEAQLPVTPRTPGQPGQKPVEHR